MCSLPTQHMSSSALISVEVLIPALVHIGALLASRRVARVSTRQGSTVSERLLSLTPGVVLATDLALEASIWGILCIAERAHFLDVPSLGLQVLWRRRRVTTVGTWSRANVGLRPAGVLAGAFCGLGGKALAF